MSCLRPEKRILYVIPIIHTSSDMGSLGPLLSEASSVALGRETWKKHLEIVAGFWGSIAQFFKSYDIKATQIYQDGLVAAGEQGLKIIDEGVQQGSLNYKIISGLLRKGAVLIKTEDITLVQREYDYIKKLTSAKSLRERETAALRYKLAQHKLLEDRDGYIAKTIDNTLKPGDRGVLFIGAYHDVLTKLPVDISTTEVKKVIKVREYHSLLRDRSVKTQERYQQLAEYLISPVLIPGQNNDMEHVRAPAGK